jgi:hypothetical protein
MNRDIRNLSLEGFIVPEIEYVVIFLVFLEELGVVFGLEEVGVGAEGFGLVSHFNEIIIRGQ